MNHSERSTANSTVNRSKTVCNQLKDRIQDVNFESVASSFLALTISKEEGLASSSNSRTLAGNALCERVDTATGESHSGMPGCRRLFAWFPVQGG